MVIFELQMVSQFKFASTKQSCQLTLARHFSQCILQHAALELVNVSSLFFFVFSFAVTLLQL